MNCKKAQRLISAKSDGELPLSQQETLDRHLAACQGCRSMATELSRLVGQLAHLAAPDPRVGFVQRVLARLNNGSPRAAPGRWIELLRPATWGLGAAAFCSGILFALWAEGLTASPELTAAEPLSAVDYLSGSAEDTLDAVLMELLEAPTSQPESEG